MKNTAGDAIRIDGSANVVFRRVVVRWDGEPSNANGAYGLYPVNSEGVLVEECEVFGASDAGIYVGQSKSILVRNNHVHGNVAGIEIENSVEADVYGNRATDNTAGILIFDLPDLLRSSIVTRAMFVPAMPFAPVPPPRCSLKSSVAPSPTPRSVRPFGATARPGRVRPSPRRNSPSRQSTSPGGSENAFCNVVRSSSPGRSTTSHPGKDDASFPPQAKRVAPNTVRPAAHTFHDRMDIGRAYHVGGTATLGAPSSPRNECRSP